MSVTLSEYTQALEGIEKRSRDIVHSVLYEFGDEIVKGWQQHYSPVDTGSYKYNWKMSVKSVSNSKYHELVIRNNTPYALWLVEGAEKGGAPWFFPGPNDGKKATRSKSGKLVVMNGRVWAGGRTLAQSAIGEDFTRSTLTENDRVKDDLAKRLANGIIAMIP